MLSYRTGVGQESTRKRTVWYLCLATVIAVLVYLAHDLEWHVLWRYRYFLLRGLLTTLVLTVVSISLGMLFKTTTLAYVIGIVEFFHAATIVNSRELIPYTTYAMLAIVYFVCCYVIAVIVKRLDPKYVLRSA